MANVLARAIFSSRPRGRDYGTPIPVKQVRLEQCGRQNLSQEGIDKSRSFNCVVKLNTRI